MELSIDQVQSKLQEIVIDEEKETKKNLFFIMLVSCQRPWIMYAPLVDSVILNLFVKSDSKFLTLSNVKFG